jgi:DNA polymerase
LLHFYDFEVWPKLWCCTIINPIRNEETVIVNDPKKLASHYAKYKNEIYIGFNNRQYDDYIFKAILSGFDAWDMNDWIINRGRKGWEFSSLLRKVQLNSFDCMIGFNGLKTLEAFMGSDIRETTIPFDYEGEFSESMIKEVLFYNRHDVMETIKTFMQRKSEFDSYMGLVKLFNLPLSYLSKSKAQLAAIITGAKKTKHNDEFDVSIPPTLRIEKYTQVVDYFKRDWNYDNNFEIEIAGVPHVYGTGGIHGAVPNYFGEGQFLHVDVNSYYPSLVIRYPEYCMTRTGASLQKFTDIYNQRLAYKAQGNPMADALKIVINSFYGAMKDPMNPLYDPRCANNICIFGQLLLTDLIERLEGHCDLIQSNTDGLIIKLHDNEEEVRAICKEWQERTGMTLSHEKVFKIAQKDVNNYIMTMEKKGKVKVEAKGAYVKDLNDLDYDLAIVNEAVRAYLLDGVPVARTINSCNDLRKFQKVVKLSNKYKWVEHEQRRTGTVKYENKAYRVFASSDHFDGRLLKCDGVRNPAKFGNTPDHCFIDNGNIVGKQVPSNLNKHWYIDLAKKRLEDFGV